MTDGTILGFLRMVGSLEDGPELFGITWALLIGAGITRYAAWAHRLTRRVVFEEDAREVWYAEIGEASWLDTFGNFCALVMLVVGIGTGTALIAQLSRMV